MIDVLPDGTALLECRIVTFKLDEDDRKARGLSMEDNTVIVDAVIDLTRLQPVSWRAYGDPADDPPEWTIIDGVDEAYTIDLSLKEFSAMYRHYLHERPRIRIN